MNSRMDTTHVTLDDERFFEWSSGVWTGKRSPFRSVGVLRNTNFNSDGSLDYSDVAQIDVEERHLPNKLLRTGDILLERSGGGPKQPVGRVALFDGRPGQYSFSNFTSRLRVKANDVFDYRFVHLFLHNFHRTGGTVPIQQNTTGIRNLNFGEYQQLRIPFVSLERQRSVVASLDTIRGSIFAAGRVQALLVELSAVLTRDALTRGLRNEILRETELGQLPESWRLERLGDVCITKSGGTPSRDVLSYWGGNIPWVKTSEINYNVITEAEESITAEGLANSSAKIFPAGTLLMAMYGQGVTRGKVARLGIPAATNQACVAFFPDETRVLSGYLFALFTLWYDNIRTLGHGANQQNLSADILKSMVIPVPQDLAEQREIAELAVTLRNAVASNARRTGALRQLFDLLLNDLMGERTMPILSSKPLISMDTHA